MFVGVERFLWSNLESLSSIVFSDEGEILKDSNDPDLDYNQLIRPWKSRLGIFYVKNRTLVLDIKLMFCTAISIKSKQKALSIINNILVKSSAEEKLIEISKGKVAGFVFVINLFDIGGCDKLLKKGFKVENLIELYQ